MVHQVYFKKNKFGAKRQTFNGVHYHSGLEAQIAQELDLRIKAKDIKSVERQVKISLTAHGKHIANYFIDFVITHNDGSKEFLEVKGYPTEVWRIKWKMLEAQLAEEDPMAIMTVYKESQIKFTGGSR
jgi:hypothetical protein